MAEGPEMKKTPPELLKYTGANLLRVFLEKQKAYWKLKTDRDIDYFSNATLFKYTGTIHNEGDHQRLESRSFPDNEANPGYAGIYTNGGEFPLMHDHASWDDSLSQESRNSITPRVEIGVHSEHRKNGPVAESTMISYELEDGKIIPIETVGPKLGYGMNPDKQAVEANSPFRTAANIYDAHDGRIYTLSNDPNAYVNNKERNPQEKLPGRTQARICDIPVDTDDLHNPTSLVADKNYQHTDENYLTNNRFIVENLDDRTFVFPEISQDADGNYINNKYTSLTNAFHYAEGDGIIDSNSQGGPANSYNKNKSWFPDNSYNTSGYFPGIFTSYEELASVDLLEQRQSALTHNTLPNSRRRHNYYQFDGSYKNENGVYDVSDLFQWRYNEVSVLWYFRDLKITIANGGSNYRIGDILHYGFLNSSIQFQVTQVTAKGLILAGQIINQEIYLKADPSTQGLPVVFKNRSGPGSGSRLIIACKATYEVKATQIKNNLYAYVDVVPTVASDNTTAWSDYYMSSPDSNIINRSTAPSPGFSGINHGSGGPEDDDLLYEHGGNATAGPHIHLFRYVVDTSGDSYEVLDNLKVYTGKWVDQGPLGLERPCDVKALLFSNFDTNNFNNYYKFMLDILIRQINREHDITLSHEVSFCSTMYTHLAEVNPWMQPTGQPFQTGPSQSYYEGLLDRYKNVKVLRPGTILDHLAFFDKRVDPITGEISMVEITHKVLYVNAVTGQAFMYNPISKVDPLTYLTSQAGWFPLKCKDEI